MTRLNQRINGIVSGERKPPRCLKKVVASRHYRPAPDSDEDDDSGSEGNADDEGEECSQEQQLLRPPERH